MDIDRPIWERDNSKEPADVGQEEHGAVRKAGGGQVSKADSGRIQSDRINDAREAETSVHDIFWMDTEGCTKRAGGVK